MSETNVRGAGGPLEPKDRLDAILKLADASWLSMDRRREFEWKVSFGLWTALAAFSGFMLRKEISLTDRPQYIWGLGSLLSLIFILYVFLWLAGLSVRHKKDRRRAEEYWMMADEALQITDSPASQRNT